MILADQGADVIKVEEPRLGDETRQWGPPWLGQGSDRQLSAYFACANRNKRSLALDLKTEQGRRTARRLAARSQIVVENFRPGKADRLGIGWTQLSAANPALVYCSITGYGLEGPSSANPGYDYAIQACSGLMSITGPSQGPACKVGVAIADVVTGLSASTAILSALRSAERSGRGQHLDISLLDCQIASLINVASNFLATGEPPRRYGAQHANIVPYQAFPASDREFVISAGNDRQFASLCRCLGCPQLADDPRFADNPSRLRHRRLLIPMLEEKLAAKKAEEWIGILLEAGVPAAPINDIPTALSDPQVKYRGLVTQIGGISMIGSPFHPGDDSYLRLPPPRLGEHTQEILDELGNKS